MFYIITPTNTVKMTLNLEPSHSPAKMKAVATTTVAEERFRDHGQDRSPTAPTLFLRNCLSLSLYSGCQRVWYLNLLRFSE